MIVIMSFPGVSLAISPPDSSAMPSTFTYKADSYYPGQAGFHWGQLLDGIFNTASDSRDFSLMEYKYYYCYPFGGFEGSGAYSSEFIVLLSKSPIFDFFSTYSDSMASYVFEFLTETQMEGSGTIITHMSDTLRTFFSGEAIFGYYANASAEYATDSINITYHSLYGLPYSYGSGSHGGSSGGADLAYDLFYYNRFWNSSGGTGGYYHTLTPALSGWYVPGMDGYVATCITNDPMVAVGVSAPGDENSSALPVYQMMDFVIPVSSSGKDSLAWADYVYKFYNPSEHEGTLLNQALALIMEQFEVNGQNSQISGLYDTYVETYGEHINDTIHDNNVDIFNNANMALSAIQPARSLIDWFFNSGAMGWFLWLLPFGIVLTMVKIMLRRD